MRSLAPDDVVELGSGFSTQDASAARGRASGAPLRYTARRRRRDDGRPPRPSGSCARILTLEVHAVVGDFERHLVHVPPARGRRLVLFLGSTIGNLDAPDAGTALLDADPGRCSARAIGSCWASTS